MKERRGSTALGQVLIAPAVLTSHFCCDLAACKGVCCVEGESGAPLEEAEIALLERDYAQYAPYMQEEGRSAVARQGYAVLDSDGDWVTPLIGGKECAYAGFSPDGLCFCAIEKAYSEGKCAFRKPVSCWLYPIRVRKLSDGSLALNYDQWHSCAAACSKGAQLQLPVYKFLEAPIRHVFGDDFFEALERAAQ